MPRYFSLIGAVLLLGVIFFGFASCTMITRIDNGQEGVMVKKPIFFGNGGLAEEPLTTGTHYTAWTTQIIRFDMLPREFSVEFKDLMSSDGVPLDFHTTLRLQITDSVKLYREFGPKWYSNNVEQAFRTAVRQSVRKHGMNETAISSTAIDAIDSEVSNTMETYLKQTGLPVRMIQVTVGRANPPDSILTQREETAKQQQREITEQQKAKAELARIASERNRAKADQSYKNEMGLSSKDYIELERIKMMKTACSKGLCVFAEGNTPLMLSK